MHGFRCVTEFGKFLFRTLTKFSVLRMIQVVVNDVCFVEIDHQQAIA